MHKDSLFSTSLPTLVISFVMITVLMDVRWYHFLVLIWISLVIGDVEHPFIYLLANSMSSLEKYLFKSSTHFLLELFFAVELYNYVRWLLIPHQIYDLQISNRLSFHFCWWFSLLYRIFLIWCISLFLFFCFFCLCFWCSVRFSRSVVSDALRPHGLLCARLPCPSPTPGACSSSFPLSQWCHQTILSSVFWC